MTKRYSDALETIRMKSTMSQRVAKKDKEYSEYAGASYDIAKKMALIDTLLEFGFFNEPIAKIIRFYRAYLTKQRKAFFASVGCTEISKLGFILGLEIGTISAT